MIHAISVRLATSLKKKVPDHPGSIEVLAYALSFILNTGSVVGLSLIAAALLGKLQSVIIVLLSFAVLRQISGGYHLKSGVLCILASTAIMVSLSFADFTPGVTLTLNFTSLVLALLFAPSRIDLQSRIPKKYYGYLKTASVALILISVFIGSSVLAASFFAQALTLIRTRR